MAKDQPKFDYEFSVVKFIPNRVRFEPVNIGVALLDKTNKILYRRFITNFDEFSRRTGEDSDFEALFKNYTTVENNVNLDILNKLRDTIDDSIAFSKPKPVSIKNIDEDFKVLFDVSISIKDAE